ncbi:bifunctional riboflavin kinase/FAD synthetase [Naasia lichenicola]|uniref:Riboflavin biosynthesis protein n=1 Tax=Naasia lichenicola TaxID=2565933 RepID=A0A4S4FPZ2_9MICO|nr:bifunctional riboflavin kinase/FAD synthetase [Naasia lichenicola]THG32378.1 bifunctional riboflavin kinase/FAD synthetase [Naasia lichenicola]
MEVFRDLAGLPSGYGPSAVTIGKFDGVHTGHRMILDEMLAQAHRRGIASVVVTFDRNPLALLAPERCPESLVSLDQKLQLLAETGIDATLVLTFDAAMAAKSPVEFVDEVLVRGLAAQVVMVGPNFRFGARGAGDGAMLQELGAERGFEAVVAPIRESDGDAVSSSRIRRLLDEGDVARAAQLLGREPLVHGIVVHGLKRGRELGFPTANLAAEAVGFAPGDGVYAGWFTDHSVPGTPRYPAAISVGTNPTFDDVSRKTIEAHVLDRTLDLYGHEVDVTFAARIRGMVAYDGVGPLIAQMGRDVQDARELLAGG